MVSWSIGHFDFCHPSEEQMSVRVDLGTEVVSLSGLEPSPFAETDPWALIVERAAREICSHLIDTQREKAEHLLAWLEDEDNETALWGAWKDHRRGVLLKRREGIDAELAKLGS